MNDVGGVIIDNNLSFPPKRGKPKLKKHTVLLIKTVTTIISRRNSSVAKDEMWFSREKKLIKQDKAIDDFDDK